MKLLLLLLLTACASRFENFEKIHPGMSKVDLRSEMTMVEGTLTFPPYEFRTYSGGMVMLKDDVVVQAFASTDDQDFRVKTKTTGGKALIYAPIHVVPVAGQEALIEKLKLLLRLRGYTVTSKDTGSVARMVVDYKTMPLELNISVKTESNPNAFWSIEVAPDSDDNAKTLQPVMVAAAIEVFNRQDGSKPVEIRNTNVLHQILLNAAPVYEMLQQDKTLRD